VVGVAVVVLADEENSNMFLVGVAVTVLVARAKNSLPQLTSGVEVGEGDASGVDEPGLAGTSAFEETTVDKTAPITRKQATQTKGIHRVTGA